MPEPSGDHEIDINDDDGDDDSQDEERGVDEAVGRMSAADQAAARQLAGSVAEASRQIQEIAGQLQIEILSRFPANGVQNPFEIPAAGQGSPTLEQIQEVVRSEVQRLAPKETFLNNIKYRYFVAVFGIMGAIAATNNVIALLKSSMGHQAMLAEDAPMERARKLMEPVLATAPLLSAGTPEEQAVTNAWRLGDDDAAFWGKFAAYAANNKPRSYSEQLTFMQLTGDLSVRLMTQPWTWDSAQDKLDLVGRLLVEMQTKTLSAAYTLLPSLTYKGNKLPRAISADLMSLTLAEWAKSSSA